MARHILEYGMVLAGILLDLRQQQPLEIRKYLNQNLKKK